MVQDIERDEAKFIFGDKEDIFSVTNVLKQCAYRLPSDRERWRLIRQTCANCPSPFSPYLTPSESSTRRSEVSTAKHKLYIRERAVAADIARNAHSQQL